MEGDFAIPDSGAVKLASKPLDAHDVTTLNDARAEISQLRHALRSSPGVSARISAAALSAAAAGSPHSLESIVVFFDYTSVHGVEFRFRDGSSRQYGQCQPEADRVGQGVGQASPSLQYAKFGPVERGAYLTEFEGVAWGIAGEESLVAVKFLTSDFASSGYIGPRATGPELDPSARSFFFDSAVVLRSRSTSAAVTWPRATTSPSGRPRSFT